MKFYKYLMGIAAAGLALTACNDDDTFDAIGAAPEPPIIDIVPEAPSIKPKAVWIDCHANYELLSKAANIDAQLEKMKAAGFNMIYLDVKPGNGYALYKSDILPYCDKFADLTVERDYDDYLGYFLQKCEELEIDVIGSIGAMGWGMQSPTYKQGYVYDNWDQWKDKVQVRSDNRNPDITVPISDDTERVEGYREAQSVTMLDPMYPEVQDLLVSVATELVTKYPKLKGVSLDYCRYANNEGGYFGMSDANMQGYADYWNESKPTRHEIVTPTGGVGPKFAKWIEFRAMNVTTCIRRVSEAIKAVNPENELHLWAGADWWGRYSVGQNWASQNYIPSGFQYTPTYNKTGFAEYLDVFVTGAYATQVWVSEDLSNKWNVEYFCKTWQNYILGACRCFGSIAAYNHDEVGNADATYLCLKHTDGYMNFELSHLNRRSLWDSSKNGIDRYEHPENYDQQEDTLY